MSFFLFFDFSKQMSSVYAQIRLCANSTMRKLGRSEYAKAQEKATSKTKNNQQNKKQPLKQKATSNQQTTTNLYQHHKRKLIQLQTCTTANFYHISKL